MTEGLPAFAMTNKGNYGILLFCEVRYYRA
jgi:hypothetical protein